MSENDSPQPPAEQSLSVGDISPSGTGNISNVNQAGRDIIQTFSSQTHNLVQNFSFEGTESSGPLDELLRSCTVRLSIPGKTGWSTGFFIAPGKILTCAREVKEAGDRPVNVFWQGKPSSEATTFDATVVEQFPQVDLAVLEFKPDDLNLPKNLPHPCHPCVYLDETVQSDEEVYT